MGDNYKKFTLIYIAVVLLLCSYVILKTDVLPKEMRKEIRAFFTPALCTERNFGDFCGGFLPVMDYAKQYEEEQTVIDTGYDKVAVSIDNIEVQEDMVQTATTEEPLLLDATSTDAMTAQALAPVEPLPAIDGITYSVEQLQDFDFLVANCYTVDSSTSVNPDELNAANLLSKDLTIDNSSGEYKILIYHTHGSETFSDSRPGYVEDTVIGVGDELTRILQEDYGIPVYHDRTVYDVVDGVEDRSLAYDLAGEGVDAILEQYPSIEVVLDIHRDGVRNEVRLVKDIDGRPTAQIMFLNGVSRLNVNGDIDYLYNPYKIDNLAFSLQMHLVGKELYGDLMRRIYIRGYCFNLNKVPRASLIEVGAQTNTVEEAKNAMTPLGAILYKVLIAQ
ncbi:MAG: stage II sporulation protein P [Wujia sp.]